MKTLILTTPELTGTEVVAAQKTLETNQYGVYLTGPTDGQFGPLTAQACYRAKYWLGYSLGSCTKEYGTKLNNLLLGKSKLTPVMAKRRADRLAAVQAEPLRVKAYKSAITQLGITENPPGSNDNPYGAWYGYNGVSWCAEFVSWNYFKAGSVSFKPKTTYAYVPYIVDDARAGRNNLALTIDPKQGDIVCYDWPGESPGLADHTGLFEAWVDQSAGTFTAIEGNTSGASNSDGGQVERRDRVKSEVIAFAHVGK